MTTWEKRWNTPQEYIKHTLAEWGLFDLERDELIGEPCGLIDPNLMGTTVFGAELGWTAPHLATMKVDLWCKRCELQTREFLREIKKMKESGEKIKKPDFLDQAIERINNFRENKRSGCSPGCLWWDYYQAKRDNVYKKFEVSSERDLDAEIDRL